MIEEFEENWLTSEYDSDKMGGRIEDCFNIPDREDVDPRYEQMLKEID